MAIRSEAVIVVLLGLVAAGCIGPKDAGVNTASVANNTTENATCFNGCSNLAALNETNKTMGAGMDAMSHPHDYWAGRSRVTVFTEHVDMQAAGATDSANYKAIADFHPPQAPGAFVYEGTEHVEITITNPTRHACVWEAGTLGGYPYCSDLLSNVTGEPVPNVPPVSDPTGSVTGLTLRYKHAATTEWIEGGAVALDKPTVIKLTDPRQSDMPHATASSWSFEIQSPNEQDRTLSFDVKMDIVRGPGAIPLWPGHPDFYANGAARRVLDKDAIACDGSSCQLPDAKDAGPIKAGRLISYGTRTLYVWINITSVFDPNPALAVDNWFLWHWNSTGFDNITDPFDKTVHGADVKSHAWVLPVDDNGMDSPYSDGSKWKFQLGGAFYKQGLSCYGGCADWYAKYHVTVIATNQVLDTSKYDWACLRNDYCPKPNATASAEFVVAPPRADDAAPAAPGAPLLLAPART